MSTNTTDPTKPTRGSAKAKSSTKTTKATLKESVAPTQLDLERRGKGFSPERLERRLVALDAAREPTPKELAECYDRGDIHGIIKRHPHLTLKAIVSSIAADDPRMTGHATKLLTALLKQTAGLSPRASSRARAVADATPPTDVTPVQSSAGSDSDPRTVRRPISIDMSAPQDPPSLFEGSPTIYGE